MTKCGKCGLREPNKRFVCPHKVCPMGLNTTSLGGRTGSWEDSEDIYELAPMQEWAVDPTSTRKRGR